MSRHRQIRSGSRPGHQPKWLRLAAALLLVVAISGCVTPARDDPQYRAKALATVRAASSEVATAQMATGQLLRKRAFGTYADEVVPGDEGARGSNSAAFTEGIDFTSSTVLGHSSIADGITSSYHFK